MRQNERYFVECDSCYAVYASKHDRDINECAACGSNSFTTIVDMVIDDKIDELKKEAKYGR